MKKKGYAICELQITYPQNYQKKKLNSQNSTTNPYDMQGPKSNSLCINP